MNKRKMRMMGMVLAGVLAMTPFLHGCATDDGGSSNDNGSQNATEQQEQNGSEQQNTGSQGDVVYYGQVMGVNGDEITVVLGDLSAADGEGLQKFEAQEDEVTFNKGDVVIVDSYIPYGKPLVKRVIGKAGDTIDIDFTAGIVYRNGEALEEPYTAEPTYTYEGMDFPLTVPDNCLFLMGDNRNASLDSRSSYVGCIDERDILGKVLLCFLPFSDFGVVK